jgi:hypothetical protein
VTCGNFRQIARTRALRAPEIDLKCERILAARIAIDHPLQRRIGHEAAIPVMLAIDLNRRKSRWKCTARHDVLRSDLVGAGVEIDEVAGPDIDRARAEARHSRIEAIKIHQALKRVLEVAGVVEAGCPGRSPRSEPRHHRSHREEARSAGRDREIGAHLIEEVARVVAPRQITEGIIQPIPRGARSHMRPKFPQPIDAGIGRVAGDDGGVDRTDRDTGNPVRMDVGFRERLVDTALICPESTAALQQQGNALERQPSFRGHEVWSKLEIHCVLSF